jgi:hypothetical protein
MLDSGPVFPNSNLECSALENSRFFKLFGYNNPGLKGSSAGNFAKASIVQILGESIAARRKKNNDLGGFLQDLGSCNSDKLICKAIESYSFGFVMGNDFDLVLKIFAKSFVLYVACKGLRTYLKADVDYGWYQFGLIVDHAMVGQECVNFFKNV